MRSDDGRIDHLQRGVGQCASSKPFHLPGSWSPRRTWPGLCVGADFCVSARGFMFALGCIQALRCNNNTCPTGITTHNPRLQRGLDPADKAIRVQHYIENMVHEIGVIAHSCGVREPRLLRRYHASIMVHDGRVRSISEIHPDVAPPSAVVSPASVSPKAP